MVTEDMKLHPQKAELEVVKKDKSEKSVEIPSKNPSGMIYTRKLKGTGPAPTITVPPELAQRAYEAMKQEKGRAERVSSR